LIQGGAAWSYQLHPSPHSLPVAQTLRRALDLNIRAFDTSPYYDPSEQILGAAFQDPLISSVYPRSSYLLITKVGRVASSTFDYSPAAVRASVERSLTRFQTSYFDVVFCHDVEFVSESSALDALAVLWGLVSEGKIRYVGISGYPLGTLIRLAGLAREKFGRPLDVVQSWGQLTLQNSRLLSEGLEGFGAAGVGVVCASSPLGIGLLRDGGVPEGKLGDFHPAPRELRERVRKAAEVVRGRGDRMARLALRYSFWEAARERGEGAPRVCVIGGAGSVEEVEDFASAFEDARTGWREEDERLVGEVREVLGDWVDY
ncbi:Aldo/keto reductase, partial [Aaosphaeria arxii CBS 175.79]